MPPKRQRLVEVAEVEWPEELKAPFLTPRADGFVYVTVVGIPFIGYIAFWAHPGLSMFDFFLNFTPK